eukprot:144900_1
MQQVSFILAVIVSALNAVHIDVPPMDVWFQLKNKQTDKCMYSNTEGGRNELGSHQCVQDWNDQSWSIYRQDGEWFMLRNQNSGLCVYSNGERDEIFHYQCHPEFEDQWFRIDMVLHSPAQTFRLKSKSSNKCLYSGGGDSLSHKECNYQNDLKWKFEFEPYKIVDVEFDTHKADMLHERPMVVGSAMCNNQYGSGQSKVQLTVQKQLSQKSSFQFKTGFSITFGVKGKAGVPCVAEGEVSLSATGSVEFVWGSEQTSTQTYGAVFDVNAGPGEIVEGVATVNYAEIEMPYKITLETIGGGVQFTSEGIWTGQTSWNLSFQTRKLDSVPKRRRIAPLERKVKR